MHKQNIVHFNLVILMKLLAAAFSVGVVLIPKSSFGVPGQSSIDNRRLGFSVNAAQDGNYDEAFQLARRTGIKSTTLSLNWSTIEPTTGHFNDVWLKDANVYYPKMNISVDLILRPINTNRIEMPANLMGKTFDSPAVIQSFENMLDHVFAVTPNLKIATLGIGNEVDGTLGADQTKWAQYKTFYYSIVRYVHSRRPGLPLGVICTFDGLTGRRGGFARSLNSASDIVMTTYYPVSPKFTAESPSIVGKDFDLIAKDYTGRQIVFTEAGYPSSGICGSSEQAQAEFIAKLFTAWDEHKSQITAITLSWLTDISPTSTNSFQIYYGIGSRSFEAYLGSLGLRTYPGAGRDKLAFQTLCFETKTRGW